MNSSVHEHGHFRQTTKVDAHEIKGFHSILNDDKHNASLPV